MTEFETPLPAETPTRKRTFSRRLALAFASVAALTALFAGVLLSAVWNVQFTAYVRDNLQRTADYVAQVAQVAYPQYGGWTIATMGQIPRSNPGAGIGIQIVDSTDQVVYDEASMSEHLQAMMRGDTTGQNTRPTVTLSPKGQVVTSAVMVNGKQVGTVRVWAYGANSTLTERDEAFKNGSLTGLAVAALVAIAFASVAGLVYANRLVRPIERITATAEALRTGDSDARTGLDTDDEIGLLGKTFDEMADAIEADREMERRLTADVAHELRTPLQAIQATVEAMQDNVLPADEEHLGIVRDETVRLARLASGILELTKLERGSVPFECQITDLAQPVRAAVDAHEALFETSELVLAVDITDHVYVVGNSDRLQQAVGNLLSNAARYTPAGGRVSIALRREGRDAVIDVADTGIGIAEEDAPYVFSRFWRADSARATATGGLGIGLAVTKEIVERHKGTVGVSRREEGGTLFTIRIPLS